MNGDSLASSAFTSAALASNTLAGLVLKTIAALSSTGVMAGGCVGAGAGVVDATGTCSGITVVCSFFAGSCFNAAAMSSFDMPSGKVTGPYPITSTVCAIIYSHLPV